MIRDVARRNPPATAAGLAGAVAFLLRDLVDWGMTLLPSSVPSSVEDSLFGVAVATIAAIAAGVGKTAQRFTWPDDKVRERLRAVYLHVPTSVAGDEADVLEVEAALLEQTAKPTSELDGPQPEGL